MQNLIAGRLDFMCDSIVTALPQIQGNAVKAIAILSPSRARVLPNLATSREQGSPEVTVDIWGAFFLPKGTPGPIIHRLNQAASETLDTPSVGERLEGLGVRVPTPEHRSPGYLADCCGATSKVGLTESSPPESPDSGERRDGGEEDVTHPELGSQYLGQS